MFRRQSFLAAFLILVACATARPPRQAFELFVNSDSGEVWPVIASARIYADGTLTLGDGDQLRVRRVSTTNPTFLRIMKTLGTMSFREELKAAAVASAQWRSSGPRIRIERDNTIALVKPPIAQADIRAVLDDVNLLFAETFGRHYQRIDTN